MNAHTLLSAERHDKSQVPFNLLNENGTNDLPKCMASDFRTALLWHMDKNETRMTDIVRATGVSNDVLKKLRTRENYSTTVENGLLIAAFYGKTVNQFVALEETSENDVISALVSMMQPEEKQLLADKIRQILSGRAQK